MLTLYLPKPIAEYYYLPSMQKSFLLSWKIFFFSQTKTPYLSFLNALYDIGSKIKPFKPSFYFNSQPRCPKYNWYRILKAISKINISDIFETLTFKPPDLLIQTLSRSFHTPSKKTQLSLYTRILLLKPQILLRKKLPSG